MGKLDELRFFNDPLISRDKKDEALYKLLLSKDRKSRTVLLKAFQPMVENIADRFAQKTNVSYRVLPRTTANFMRVADKTGEMLRKYNGNIKVIGLANYMEQQLWLTMHQWYQQKYGLLTKDDACSKKYRKH